MPINIPNGLPAKQILESEKIFALEEDVARKQDIRPLRIVILNLMPKKIETETQILRLISKSPLQVDIDFMMVSNHVSKNTSAVHRWSIWNLRRSITGTSFVKSWNGAKLMCTPRCISAGVHRQDCIIIIIFRSI